jgi:hypothetical protein
MLAPASVGSPGLRRGISAVALTSEDPFLPGIPRATFFPLISIASPDSFAPVNRVWIQPKAMQFDLTPNGPHSFATAVYYLSA